jgi:hypothetical protein
MAWELADSDLQDAIADTEGEIFGEATGGPDPDEMFDNDTLLDQLSQMHDWNDNSVTDLQLAGESSGDRAPGSTLAVDDDDLEAARQEGYQAGAQALYREIAPHLPQPQRPDMFADPEGWEANLLAQMRGGGMVPPPNGYGQPLPGKPDMFSDPDGYERWMLAEARRQSGVNEFNEARINGSMAAAHREFGQDFAQAYNDIRTGLDPSNPGHRNLVMNVINSPDPGRALMQARDFVESANESTARYGGPPFAPGLVRRGAPLRNSAGDAPQSREEALEQSIFNEATGLNDIWSQF